MNKQQSFKSALVLALVVGLLGLAGGHAAEAKQKPKAGKTAGAEAPPAAKFELDPKAIDVLKAMCGRLAAARAMSFTAVVTYESPSRLGVPLAYTTRSEVTLQRPDKLRVITVGDGPATEFYYNGKTMTAFAPAEDLIAVADAPPTIDAALKAVYESAATYFPFADLIVSDPCKDLLDGLILAFYIGQSKVVGGVTTDMVAYADKDVFVQIWIGVEDKLPRMMRAVYRTDPSRLRHLLELSNWQLDPAVAEDAFAPKNAGSAKPMPFAHPAAKPSQPSGAPAQGKSTKK